MSGPSECQDTCVCVCVFVCVFVCFCGCTDAIQYVSQRVPYLTGTNGGEDGAGRRRGGRGGISSREGTWGVEQGTEPREDS